MARVLRFAPSVLACTLFAWCVSAAPLPRGGLSVLDIDGRLLKAATDNDIRSAAVVVSDRPVVRAVIDLGSVHTVHRVVVTSARERTPNHAMEPGRDAGHTMYLRVDVGQRPKPQGRPEAMIQVRAATRPETRFAAAARFQPAAGRYVTLELDRLDARSSWNLAEVEVHGWQGDLTRERRDAVVLDKHAPPPLKLAADELSYYLGELVGHPVPIVRPGDADDYTGRLFHVVDLAPRVAADDGDAAQVPPAPVNIEVRGREILFRAWPYRNVLWSVWEFLDRQGVRWLYPDAHGEFVPAGKGLDLAMLPLAYTPPTDVIYANFGVEYFRSAPDAFLHFWRNRWTHTWGGHERDAFGGDEVPQPRGDPPSNPDYAEGFGGYPHNFNNVIPNRILEKNIAWCGVVTNRHWRSRVEGDVFDRPLPPSRNWCTFNLTHPAARDFIVEKAVACWPDHRRRHGDILWLLPDDAMLFSEDEASLRLRSPLLGDSLPYAFPYLHSVSGDYYDFIADIAERLRQRIPDARIGAMAYSNTHRPPARMERLPSNVVVDVCLYGARNLPLSSPHNAEVLRRLEAWTRIATHVRHYDYDLIHSEKAGPVKPPVPLVGAMADRARVFAELDMLDGGTQADLETLPFNPWNYYAYPRLRWRDDLDHEAVLREFFDGYYREAGASMRAYYETAEDSLHRRDVNLQGFGYDYELVEGAYDLPALRAMQKHLRAAERAAGSWIVRERVATAREGFVALLRAMRVGEDDLAR